MSLPARYIATVLERRDYGCASELVFAVPGDFDPQPGQFVHVLCGDRGRILRRPFSVFDRGEGTASILVREAGAGSSWLRGRAEGERLDLLGPLGRGFYTAKQEMSLLVAGGVGIAPLHFLARRLRRAGKPFLVAWGMESAEEFAGLPGILAREFDLRIACMDGGAGPARSAVDLACGMHDWLEATVYACGPRAMLVALAARVADAQEGGLARLQVSVEERMACGLGVCRGCAVPAARPPGSYLAACSDGPVFGGDELDWERMAALT
ncbi:MAG: dihydroorotate dehydrogenase electron transfer subunit [Actinobacteria bacterium]|nr:dihydroorotate dehydrogenase electron transfer subunit [Actinomycetota bacterium]